MSVTFAPRFVSGAAAPWCSADRPDVIGGSVTSSRPAARIRRWNWSDKSSKARTWAHVRRPAASQTYSCCGQRWQSLIAAPQRCVSRSLMTRHALRWAPSMRHWLRTRSTGSRATQNVSWSA